MTTPAASAPALPASVTASAPSVARPPASAVLPPVPQPQATTASAVQPSPGWLEPGSLSWEWAKAAPGALIPALVAIAVGVIAYRQYKVAHAKLNADLFDRRYAAYHTLWEFMSWRVYNEGPNPDLQVKLQNSAPEFRFLFGAEIYAYVRQAMDKAVELESARRQVRDLALYDHHGERPAALASSRLLVLWFEAEAKGLAERFAYYLDFSVWSSQGSWWRRKWSGLSSLWGRLIHWLTSLGRHRAE